jgi:hypothetical protein
LILDENQEIYAFTRTLEDERLLVILNFTRNKPTFALPDSVSFSDKELVISNYSVDPVQDIRLLTLQPYEARVYTLRRCRQAGCRRGGRRTQGGHRSRSAGELHGEVADAAAGTEDHDRLGGLESQRVIQAAKRGHRVHGHRARMLGRQLAGDARDVVGLDRGILGVETALGIQQAESVDAVAGLEPLDAIARGRNGVRAIRAKQIEELRLDAEFPGEAALALERVPLAHAGPTRHGSAPHWGRPRALEAFAVSSSQDRRNDRARSPSLCSALPRS